MKNFVLGKFGVKEAEKLTFGEYLPDSGSESFLLLRKLLLLEMLVWLYDW